MVPQIQESGTEALETHKCLWTQKMEACMLIMEPWRVHRPVVDGLFDEEQDPNPDPHWSEKLDPDPHLSDADSQPCFHLLKFSSVFVFTFEKGPVQYVSAS